MFYTELESTSDGSCPRGVVRKPQGLTICFIAEAWGRLLLRNLEEASLFSSRLLLCHLWESRKPDLLISVVLAFRKPGETRQIHPEPLPILAHPPNQQISGGRALPGASRFPGHALEQPEALLQGFGQSYTRSPPSTERPEVASLGKMRVAEMMRVLGRLLYFQPPSPHPPQHHHHLQSVLPDNLLSISPVSFGMFIS